MSKSRFPQSISVVLPAYNEEECIGEAVSQCLAYLTEAFAGSTQWVRLAEGTEIVPFECDAEMAAQSTSQGGTDG